MLVASRRFDGSRSRKTKGSHLAKSAFDTLGAHFVLSKWYSNADLMQKITYVMHTLCILCINFMHTMCILCETSDLGGCRSAQVTVAFYKFSRCSLLTTTCEKPARMVWGPLDPFCDSRFWGRWCTTLHVTPRTPKTTGRSGGPGGQQKVQPAHPDVWKVSRHGLGAAGPLL